MELPPLKCVARIRSDFPTKFGIPRQSGLVEALRATVVFEPEYRDPAALRGLEGFSHLWLLWLFSASVREGWSPTVRPPRLGGNVRMGVFATRSPFRPNPIGLSSVRLEGVDLHTPEGPVLVVSGADLMDGTPILDIKPYLPYGDCHPEASARTSGRPCWASWPGTPGPPIRATRSGSTAWPLPGGTSGSPWPGRSSPSGRSPRWRRMPHPRADRAGPGTTEKDRRCCGGPFRFFIPRPIASRGGRSRPPARAGPDPPGPGGTSRCSRRSGPRRGPARSPAPGRSPGRTPAPDRPQPAPGPRRGRRPAPPPGRRRSSSGRPARPGPPPPRRPRPPG